MKKSPTWIWEAFDITLPSEFAYYVVMPEASAERPKIAAFRNWLMDEAKGEINAHR